MSRFTLAPRAAADLEHIRDRIASGNPARAATYLEEMLRHFQFLSEQPLIGRARRQFGANIRSMPHGNYVIFFRLASHGIEVIRVKHSKQDLSQGL